MIKVKELKFCSLLFSIGTLLIQVASLAQTKSLVKPPKVQNKQSSQILKVKDQKFKIKDLSKINISFDSAISKKEYPIYNYLKIETPNLKLPDSPSLIPTNEWSKMLLIPNASKSLQEIKSPIETQNLTQFNILEVLPFPDSPLNLKEIEPISLNEFKLIEALTILDLKENYELALALLSETINDPKYSQHSRWSLTRAALPLGLRNETITQLFLIINQSKSENSELRTKSIKSLIELTRTSDIDMAQQIYPHALLQKIEPTTWGAFSIAIVKDLMDKKNLNDAFAIIESIPEDSPLKLEALFLKALIKYRSNQIDLAQSDLESLVKRTEESKANWDVKSLAAMTLARIYFQKEDFKNAYSTYQKVEKNNALWLQSLIETAWAQILNKDYVGAAGNMFSLHTDYFKNAYQPESYIVRTVSYLNLCQFGDSLTVLQQFLRKYSQADKKIDDYLSKFNKKTTYETIKKLLISPLAKEADGLPRSLIIEMARDPRFVSLQKRINELEDESQTYNKIQNELKEKEKKWIAKIEEIKKRQAQIKNFLKENHDDEQKAAVQKESLSNDKKIMKLKLLQEVTARAYTLLQKFQKEAISRLMAQKDLIKLDASEVLFNRIKIVSQELKHWLTQSELLHYEIYSGAGEHLRFQMASENPDSVKKQLTADELKAKKAEANMQWDFRGEIWEDEIGNFKSSLNNVCAEKE